VISAIIFAFSTGVTKVLSRTINAKLASEAGTELSTVVNFITGLIVSSLLVIFSDSFRFFQQLPAIKSWSLLGGVISVAVVLLFNTTVKQISSITMTLLVFLGQVFAGIILDMVLVGRFSTVNLIGGFFTTIGLIFILFGSKTQNSGLSKDKAPCTS